MYFVGSMYMMSGSKRGKNSSGIKIEQFIYDGDERNIKARYCAGELLDETIWEK